MDENGLSNSYEVEFKIFNTYSEVELEEFSGAFD
jgi:hypothetical protein